MEECIIGKLKINSTKNVMKKLFVYFSLGGNGDVVANALSKKDYEIRKLELSKPIKKIGFFTIFKGGFQAMRNKCAKLKDFDHNVEGYDEIIIGSPIWNGRLCPAINTLLKECAWERKNVNFILYSGSGTGEQAKNKISSLFPEAKITILKEPKKYSDELNKIS